MPVRSGHPPTWFLRAARACWAPESWADAMGTALRGLGAQEMVEITGPKPSLNSAHVTLCSHVEYTWLLLNSTSQLSQRSFRKDQCPNLQIRHLPIFTAVSEEAAGGGGGDWGRGQGGREGRRAEEGAPRVRTMKAPECFWNARRF